MAKGSSVVLSIFARIFLIVSYALCLLTFVFAAIILLMPNYSDSLQNVGYWHFANSSLTGKPTELSGAGIAVMILWAFSLIFSIITVVALKKSKYTIGKNNKVTRVFIPINIAILFVVVMGLVSQPGLAHIGNSVSLLVRHWNGSVSMKSLNFDNYTVVGYVFFGITIFLALGIVFDIIGFVFRIFFSRTKDKANANG